MDFSFVPNYRSMNHTCYFCGEKRSVKYVIRKDGKNFYACNKCVLQGIGRLEESSPKLFEAGIEQDSGF